MTPVAESWERIRTWLGKHAPKILKGLNPGATSEAIADAERLLEISMPDDWRELYRGHDGLSPDGNQGNLFHGMNFLPLNAVVAECLQNLKATKDAGTVYSPERVNASDPGIMKEDFQNDGWIPLGSDWGETVIRVDTNPAPDGNRGQVIATDHAYGVVMLLAPSVTQFVANFAADLEAGRYSLLPEALADGNEFLNCDSEIDVSNWWKSPRWKHLERR